MGNTYVQRVLSLFIVYMVAKNAAQSESDIFLDDYSIIPYGQSEVHGIDASDTAIAIATSDRLYLYNLTRPVQLIGKINLDSPVTEQPGFLELKLLSDTDIGYCDTTVCCYCTFQLNNASCKNLNLTFDDVTSYHMTSASMAFDYPLLTLRLVDNKDRSAILRFDVLEPRTTLRVKQYAVDLKNRSKQFTIKGFVRDGYSYFVGTNIPTRHGSSLEKTAMIITRICNNDSTLELYSRMDQHINCSRTATGITAAYYDPKRDQLWIIVRSPNHAEMCRFEMKMVHEKFTNNWRICIKNSESNVIKNKLSIPISNCEVQQGSPDEYQFGWLENTQPLTGKGLLG